MRVTRKIMALSGIVLGIGVCWLGPMIHAGKEIRYVRYYENVDAPAKLTTTLGAADTAARPKPPKREKKTYKKEVLEPRRARDVSAKMFSRAVQFEPMLTSADSIGLVAETDSLLAIQ